MKRIKDKPERISLSLLDAFDKIKRERFGSGKDRVPISTARLTDALAKHPSFPAIIEDLKRRPSKRWTKKDR